MDEMNLDDFSRLTDISRWHLQGWLLVIAVGICSSLSGAGLDVGVQGAIVLNMWSL